MTSNPRQQPGLAMSGWCLLIVFFGMAITMGMKFVTLGMDHNTMSGRMSGMAVENALACKRKADLRSLIMLRFKINKVRDLNMKDNIKSKRTKNGTELIKAYETRQNLFSNLIS